MVDVVEKESVSSDKNVAFRRLASLMLTAPAAIPYYVGSAVTLKQQHYIHSIPPIRRRRKLPIRLLLEVSDTP